jgi:cytidine deaminase
MALQCEDIINIYPFDVKEKLVKIFNSSDFAGMIVHDDVGELVELLEISEEQLMQELVYIAQQYAIPPISNFRVGAVVRGESGNFYFGANLEFPGETLAFTLHAEQAAIVNAMTHDERKITTIATTYIPCCLCRQFMLELESAERLKIVLPDIVYSLLNIVPHSFGPVDLKINVRLMQKMDNSLLKNGINYSNDELVLEALSAANKSYAPYSKSYSGVALLTKDDRIFTGRYAENAAFNISMNPMMAAISNLNMSNLNFKDISRAVIVEPKNNTVSQIKSAGNLLYVVNPNVDLEIVKVN